MLLRRFLALLLLAMVIPAVWLRSPAPRADDAPHAGFISLPLPEGCCTLGPLRLTQAWHVRSDHPWFGGYSALVPLGAGQFLALGDGGDTLRFLAPDRAQVPFQAVQFGTLFATGAARKSDRDTEAVQRDGATGDLWIAAEGQNAILRRTPLGATSRYQPAALAHWPVNTGPETMALLPGAALLVICECHSRWRDAAAYPAVFWPSGLDATQPPIRLFVAGPWDFRPTDAAVLPDGRVLVVLRKLVWPFPARFAARLALLDPAAIKAGAAVPLHDLGPLPADVPMDNYEGLAIEPLRGNRAAIWLISDDNHAALQRTLLLRFELDLAGLPAKQKARS